MEQNDLNEAVTLYSFFKGNKKEFSKINTDQRCKIQPINKFAPGGHWSIERWWTKEEQIELGIVEEDNSIDINAFGDLLSEISVSLKEQSLFLKENSEKKSKNTIYKEVSLSDRTLFDLFIGKRIVKRDLVNVKGTIPIYSANVKEPIGFHTKSNITDFKNNFVLWGIDGDFEFNYFKKETPFVSTDHCGAIRILSDDILPEYLTIQLESIKHKYGFDRGLRASLKNMKTVSIQLPYTQEGLIDIQKQNEIVEKYQNIRETKKRSKSIKTN